MYERSYQPSKTLLADRVVLITGAGDGIGRALAMACARVGATVVLLGRTVRKLEAVYDEILAATGRQPAIYPFDLLGASPDDYADAVAALRRELGRLDGLVHNAAVLGDLSPIEHYEPSTWAKVMHVNVNAVFLLTRAALPLLMEAEDGSIVLTTADVGRRAKAYWGAYAVSKFATEGLMQVLADELSSRPAPRVNCVNPGPVRTRLRAAAYPAEDPAGLLPPEAVAAAYLYLLGPDGRGVNGELINAQ